MPKNVRSLQVHVVYQMKLCQLVIKYIVCRKRRRRHTYYIIHISRVKLYLILSGHIMIKHEMTSIVLPF